MLGKYFHFTIKDIAISLVAGWMQYHHYRSGHWVVRGMVKITNGNWVLTLWENEFPFIPQVQSTGWKTPMILSKSPADYGERTILYEWMTFRQMRNLML